MKTFQDYIDDINEFFRSQGQNIDPVPMIKIDGAEHDQLDPFVETANYNPLTKTITLFISNRQLKDILRSYCHELAHHVQNLSMGDKFVEIRKIGKLSENSELASLEEEAYRNGNMTFRKWTESAS